MSYLDFYLHNLFIIKILFSYLIGSIPFGFILIKSLKLGNIKNIGSGNIGATNVSRVVGYKLAFIILSLDILKGFLPNIIFVDDYAILGSFAFLGHIYPIWLKFNGGKGVATFVGVLMFISLPLMIIFSIVWILLLYLTKYSSIASLFSSTLISILSFLLLKNNFYIIIFFMNFIIIISHRLNILKLLKNKENKFKL